MRHIFHLANLYYHYRKKSLNVPVPPTRIWLEPTNACNLRCIMCPNGTDYNALKRGMMEWELFQELISQIKEFAYDVNLFHRGESLLHPRFVEMVKVTAESGLRARLHTNATILDEDYSREIIEAGLDFISFSFDGYDKETYEKVRVGANFEEVLGNIIKFLEIKKELGKGKPYTVIEVMEVLKGSEKELARKREEFKAKFKNLPLEKFIVRRIHNWAGLYNINRRGRLNYVPCTFPFYSMTIFYDGKVPACPQDFFGEIIIGDATKSSLLEIWNSENMKALRKSFAKEENVKHPRCQKCDMIYRETFLGIPKSYLKFFIRENI